MDPDGRIIWEALDFYSYNESRKAWAEAFQQFREDPSLETGAVAAAKFLENSYDSLALLTPGLPAIAGLTMSLREMLKGAEVSSEVFLTAVRGGKHAGFLENYVNRSVAELSRGIRSFEKNISLHLDKIDNPAKYVADWAELSDAQKAWLISTWQKHIQKGREEKEILENLKRLREEGK